MGKSKAVEQKQKIILFPFWNVEKAEKILSEQERDGYRFVRSRFNCLFTFLKSSPREARYVILYTFPKDEWPILEWESLLKSDEYHSNPIQHTFSYKFFRIAKKDIDLQDYYIARLWYARKSLIKKTIIATFFMLVGAFLTFAGEFNAIGRVLSILPFAGGLFAILSYIVGFFSIRKKRKKLIREQNNFCKDN